MAMNRITRMTAAAALTSGLGLAVAAPAHASPVPAPQQAVCPLGGIASYPPGTCTYNLGALRFVFGPNYLDIAVPLLFPNVAIRATLTNGVVTFSIVNAPPRSLATLTAPTGEAVQVTTDATGSGVLSLPATSFATGDANLALAAPGGASFSEPVKTEALVDPEGARLVSEPINAESSAAVNPIVMTTATPGQDHTTEYLVLGVAAAGGIALSGVAVGRRRKPTG